MKVALTDESIIFKTKIFESRTKNKDKIYVKYRCSIPKAISNYAMAGASKMENIFINPTAERGQYEIKFNPDDGSAESIKRKIYLSGSSQHRVYNFLIPNKLFKDSIYDYAVFTVSNDRKIFLSFE